MRFDDRLRTVLAADMHSPVGAQAAWRQLVDLIGRGRVPADQEMLAHLRTLRPQVPVEVRAASARALAFAAPDPALVALFAEDELAVAAPVLRTVTLPEAAWPTLLENSTPAGRSVLRQRRDLPDAAVRALESFGPIDFVLSYHAPTEPADEIAVWPEVVTTSPEVVATPEPELLAPPVPPEPLSILPGLPPPLDQIVPASSSAEALPQGEDVSAASASARGTFEIADLVARIDAFQRDRDNDPASVPVPRKEAASFRFDTDAAGVVRAVEGITRGALVGVSLATSATQGLAQVDSAVASAVRRCGRFAEARLEIGGTSDAAGAWRIAGEPAFDRATGRFAGYSGSARRLPGRDNAAAGGPGGGTGGSDALRQLVHELRTPANAVAGFAELIESQLLGPVPDLYRTRAVAIRDQAAELLVAIEDLDVAARIESGALELRAGTVMLRPLLDRLTRDLVPLAAQRGATLLVEGHGVSATADDRTVERIVARLLAVLLAAAQPGERIVAALDVEARQATLVATRPQALVEVADDALFALDDGGTAEGGPLLGTGFTLRLVRNLATEIGGNLALQADSLTLRLPATLDTVLKRTAAG